MASLDRDVPVLVFGNDYLDSIVHEIDMHDIQTLANILAHYLPGNYACLELPIDSPHCPFVRLYLMDWNTKHVTNFRLQTFLYAVGMSEISASCLRAVVVGSYGNVTVDRFACLPLESYMTGPPAMPVGVGGVIQACCMQPMQGNVAGKNVAQEYMGSLQFIPFTGCLPCSISRKPCSGGFPCNRCQATGKGCMLRVGEWEGRARELTRLITDNELQHHDLAKYLLHHQAAVYGGYMLVSRDIKDISLRVACTTAGPVMPEVGREDLLPSQFQEWMRVTDSYKVEWMKGGVYAVSVSEEYALNVMSGDEIICMAKRNKLAPKVVDGGRFNDIRRMYETWLISLDYPGSVCEFKGAACWKDGVVAWSKVRMISVLFENNAVITLTLMYRKL